MGHSVRHLGSQDLDALRILLNEHPFRHSLVASRLEQPGDGSVIARSFLGAFENEELSSALMLGPNIVPINTTDQTRRAFVNKLAATGHSCLSLIGHADEVLSLWHLLEPQWGSAREVRHRQPFMTMDQRSLIEIDDRVRYSTLADFDVLFPACVSMFTEEVGVSPITHGSSAYRQRVNEVITNRRSFIRRDGDEVTFKAEVSAVGNGVAQVQGVWVNPRYRGLGIAAPAIAAVVRLVLQDLAGVVALYANSYNTAALSAYRRVGFEQTDTFATVLL